MGCETFLCIFSCLSRVRILFTFDMDLSSLKECATVQYSGYKIIYALNGFSLPGILINASQFYEKMSEMSVLTFGVMMRDRSAGLGTGVVTVTYYTICIIKTL